MFTDDHHGIIPWEQPSKEETETVRQGIEAHRSRGQERATVKTPRPSIYHLLRAKTVAQP